MDIKLPPTEFQLALKALVADGMTRKSIAAKCGVTPTAIGDIYTGKTRDPRASVADALRQLAAKRIPQAA